MLAPPGPSLPIRPRGGVGYRCEWRSRGSTSLAVLAALLCLGLTAPLAHAQTGSLSGSVQSADGVPLEGASVVVLGLSVRAETDTGGLFELRHIPAGVHVIEIERFGYQKLQLVFEFDVDVALRHDFELALDPVRGDTLEARVRARMTMPPQLRGFYDRRARGYGHFFTREDVDRMQAGQFTDVLRRVPGTRIEPVSGPFGTSYVVRMGRATGIAGARDCSVLYYINGAPFVVALDVGINTYVRPQDIAAIEVYSGAASIPAQFTSTPNNSRCGVVVIWTYGGREWSDRSR